MKLNDRLCKTATPAAKNRKLADGGGLYLEVTPAGRKYWRLKYRFGGKEKRLALGVYPIVSLKDAREKTFAAKRTLDGGVDPGALKKELKQAALMPIQNTFEAVARAWHLHHKGRWAENTATNNMHRLENDVFPVIGHLAIDKLTMQQVLQPMRNIEARGASELAKRAWGLCSLIFRHAITHGIMTHNPLGQIKPIDVLKPKRQGHFASIENKHLPDFLKNLHENKARLYLGTRYAVELLLHTFVRTSELIEAEWDEFDFKTKTWLIPAERMKMREDHIVPLSTKSIEILTELKSLSGTRKYVFPHVSNPRKHMSNNTILKALERMGYKKIMTGHGFRALAMSTIKEQLGYRHEVVDRQLAHLPEGKNNRAYDRAMFLSERIEMMQKWSDYIQQISK